MHGILTLWLLTGVLWSFFKSPKASLVFHDWLSGSTINFPYISHYVPYITTAPDGGVIETPQDYMAFPVNSNSNGDPIGDF